MLKGCTRDELLNTITKAVAGENLFTRDELRRVTGAMATPRLAADIEVPLTQREADVLRQMANGLTNKEIAESLHISYETVKEQADLDPFVLHQHLVDASRRPSALLVQPPQKIGSMWILSFRTVCGMAPCWRTTSRTVLRGNLVTYRYWP